MASDLTRRTMEYLRGEGFVVDVAERHSPRPAGETHEKGRKRMSFFLDRKVDLFGAIDLVAVHLQRGIVGVQVTSASNHAARRAKILLSPELRLWAEHAQLWIVSWRKKADPPGSRRLVWKPRVEELTAADFDHEAQPRRLAHA